MASNFIDKAAKPDEASLSGMLGETKPHWDAIVAQVSSEYPSLVHEWKFYGAKHGWQLRILRKKAVVLYLIPHEGSFLAATALKKPALALLHASGLPPSFIAEIEGTKAYGEGVPARLEVTDAKHVGVVLRLLALVLGV